MHERLFHVTAFQLHGLPFEAVELGVANLEQPLAQLDLPASKRLHLPDQLAAEVEQREVGYDPLARDRLEMLAVESLDLREEVEADRVPREGPCGRIEE